MDEPFSSSEDEHSSSNVVDTTGLPEDNSRVNEVVEDLTGDENASPESPIQPAENVEDAPPFQPRNYQREMLELSLQKNLIVAVGESLR